MFKINTEMFMEDINFVEDKNKRILTQVKELSDHINNSEDVKLHAVSSTELNQLDVEGLNRYREKMRYVWDLKQRLPKLPYLISYNGAVYRVGLQEEVYHVKTIEVSGERRSKGKLKDVLILNLHRMIGLDNNLTNEDKDKLVYKNTSMVSRLAPKRVIIGVKDREYGSNYAFNELMEKGNQQEFGATEDYLLQNSEVDKRASLDLRGMDNAISEEYRQLIKPFREREWRNGDGTIFDLTRAIKLNSNDNKVKELEESTDSEGNTLFMDVITLEDLLRDSTVYVHKLQGKYGELFKDVSKDPIVQFIHTSNSMDGSMSFNLRVRKDRLRQLMGYEGRNSQDIDLGLTEEDKQKNKDYIKTLIKESIITYQRTSYFYREDEDKFKMHRVYAKPYKSGLKWDSILGVSKLGTGNNFYHEPYLEISNVYHRETYREDVGIHGSYYPGFVEVFNTIFVYNKGRRISNRVGLKEHTKQGRPESGYWVDTVDYVIEGNKMSGYTDVNRGGRVIPVRLTDKHKFKRKSIHIEDLKLPIENKLHLQIETPHIISELSQPLATYFKVRGDSRGENYVTTIQEEESGVQHGILRAYLDRINLDVNTLIRDSFSHTEESIIKHLNKELVIDLPDLNKKGKELMQSEMEERDGVLMFNIYLDKDISESEVLI